MFVDVSLMGPIMQEAGAPLDREEPPYFSRGTYRSQPMQMSRTTRSCINPVRWFGRSPASR